MDHTQRRLAGAAGILYFVTHVSSVAAVAAYGTGSAIGGVTLEFVLAISCVGTGVLLWALLREYGPARSATFALLRAVEASVIIAGTLPMLATTLVARSEERFTVAASAMHAAAFLLGQGLIISVNTIVLGWLLWESRAVPRPLAILGVIGGIVVLTSNSAQLWNVIALNGVVAAIAAIPIFAFEIWLAVYLITVGLRVRRTPKLASRTGALPAP
ncbi:MAG TPA: DUF4386 domain-containing protein [Aeromicrobium sp.]|nr:DUF4386 domain-containing protein [Aeromicrobium sp.]